MRIRFGCELDSRIYGIFSLAFLSQIRRIRVIPVERGTKVVGLISLINILHDHPVYFCCPDVLSLVGDPLSGKGCGSPNHI